VWSLIVVGQNFFSHHALLTNYPWEVLLIFLLSMILVTTNLSKRVVIGIYFVVFFIFMLLTGGYYNWTSLIIFAGMAVFMTAITYFIGTQFLKGENSKK
jgi:hypothetical protein